MCFCVSEWFFLSFSFVLDAVLFCFCLSIYFSCGLSFISLHLHKFILVFTQALSHMYKKNWMSEYILCVYGFLMDTNGMYFVHCPFLLPVFMVGWFVCYVYICMSEIVIECVCVSVYMCVCMLFMLFISILINLYEIFE